MPLAYLGLGSNLGDRSANLLDAVTLLSQLGTISVSSWYESEPWGMPGVPRFLNGAAALETGLGPLQLLEATQNVERCLGRTRRADRSRTIDIDLLFYDSIVLVNDRLVVPHPAIAYRAFVLLPLVEIAAAVRHPILGRTVSEMARMASSQGMGEARAA